jgi:hypothetical protein
LLLFYIKLYNYNLKFTSGITTTGSISHKHDLAVGIALQKFKTTTTIFDSDTTIGIDLEKVYISFITITLITKTITR